MNGVIATKRRQQAEGSGSVHLPMFSPTAAEWLRIRKQGASGQHDVKDTNSSTRINRKRLRGSTRGERLALEEEEWGA
jgi:hypothetical protein